jgi:hypothetical protein
MALDPCGECLIAKWHSVPVGKDEPPIPRSPLPSQQPQFAQELAELHKGVIAQLGLFRRELGSEALRERVGRRKNVIEERKSVARIDHLLGINERNSGLRGLPD